MLIILIGIYIFFLAFVWLFFILGKITAYKFKNFSVNLLKITNIFFIFLIIFSILGFIIIFYLSLNNEKIVDKTITQESVYY